MRALLIRPSRDSSTDSFSTHNLCWNFGMRRKSVWSGHCWLWGFRGFLYSNRSLLSMANLRACEVQRSFKGNSLKSTDEEISWRSDGWCTCKRIKINQIAMNSVSALLSRPAWPSVLNFPFWFESDFSNWSPARKTRKLLDWQISALKRTTANYSEA